jgi:hypothetical protein
MLLVGVVAVLIWVAMMGLRSYDSFQRASFYSLQERYWRENAQQDIAEGKTQTIEAKWGLRTADYYATLVRKYRRAMWRPWVAVDYEPPFFYPDRLPPAGSPQRTAPTN